MKFAGLINLWLFWIIPILIGLFYLAYFQRKRKIEKLIDPKFWMEIIPDFKTSKRILKYFLILLSIIALLLSLLRPQWGYELREVKKRGIDLFVLVDVSRSMEASDIKPSRIKRAERELIDLLDILEGDRIGLIPFAGSAYVACPLTTDYSAFRLFVDQLDTDLISLNGTNLSYALSLALESFVEVNNNSKAIILITDGENTVGSQEKVIQEIIKQGVRVYVIGMGSVDGAPIPGLNGELMKDENGKLVISKLNEASLEQLALDTNGVYVRSVTGDLDLEEIYLKGIKRVMEKRDLSLNERKIPIERFQIPLGIALFLLLIESFLRDVKKKK